MGRSSNCLFTLASRATGKDGNYLEKLHAVGDAECNSVCGMLWEIYRELRKCLVGAKGAEKEGD